MNKLILKSQQRFRSEKQNVVIDDNDAKRIQSRYAVEAYAKETNEEIIHRKEEKKRNNIIKHSKNG